MGMKGKLALCSRGFLGLITKDEPQPVTYRLCDYCTGAISGADDPSACRCVTGIAYVGIHLTEGDGHKYGDPWSSRNPVVVAESIDITVYQTFDEAIELVKDARTYQTQKWPLTALPNAGGRPFEEWLELLHRYMAKMDEVYAETPGAIRVDGQFLPNTEGKKRVRKYAAILANLAVWAVQSAMGTK